MENTANMYETIMMPDNLWSQLVNVIERGTALRLSFIVQIASKMPSVATQCRFMIPYLYVEAIIGQ